MILSVFKEFYNLQKNLFSSPLIMAYYKTRNTGTRNQGTRNTGGTPEHWRNTGALVEDTTEYWQNNRNTLE